MELETKVIKDFSNFSIESCIKNPHCLFVFGDNQERVGMGGQAIIRNCHNAIGICTKKSIMHAMRDDEYIQNQVSIDKDIMSIKKSVEDNGYTFIVFPSSGLGWGRAYMQTACPKTALYLSQRLLEEFDYNNLQDLVNSKQF